MITSEHERACRLVTITLDVEYQGEQETLDDAIAQATEAAQRAFVVAGARFAHAVDAPDQGDADDHAPDDQ
jgi:Rad3-related DNA helicase